ncbi:hypothetical protein WAF17_00495 [Bernardetia sp. ABR2-2B]|uniref:hypothetical protein n=1 Tax=Bernardetia sp. ABR2-2B TaxID=3127472 RepID=UPI0030D54C41
MSKIPTVLKNALSENSIGRVKLKLFEEITGKSDTVPSNEESITYIENLKVKDLQLLIRDVLIKRDAFLLNYLKLPQLDSCKIHFDNLKSILDEASFIFMLEELPVKFPSEIIAWVNYDSTYEDCYTVIIFNESSFPKGVLAHIKVFLLENSFKLNYLDEKGWSETIFKDKLDIDNLVVKLAFKVLIHVSNISVNRTFMSAEDMSKANEQLNNTRFAPPRDLKYDKLVADCSLHKLTCTRAVVNMDMIRPFSTSFCLEIPSEYVVEGIKDKEEFYKNGLLVYWDNESFIMSDDYIAYLISRQLEYEEIEVVIMGEYPIEKIIRVISIGTKELIPAAYLRKDEGFREDYFTSQILLTEKLDKIKRYNSVEENNKKYIILTEDSDISAIETVLKSSGFSSSEMEIDCYEGCTQIKSVELLKRRMSKIYPKMNFIVHRDRDYLTDKEIIKMREDFEKLGIYLFITEGTDIESTFINAKHINQIYPEIEIREIEEMILESTKELEEVSIDLIRKATFGRDHKKDSLVDNAMIELYKNNVERYRIGKKVYKNLKSKIQRKIKKNPDLMKESKFLKIERLVEIRKKSN